MILSSILIILFICMAICFLAAYVGWKLTHPVRKPVDDSPLHYGIVFEPVEFPSRTGDVRLKGWLLQANGPEVGKTIILSHGYAGTRLEKGLPSLELARSLIEAGYHVLMFDFRNSGESGGNLTTVGLLEKQDLLGAVDWVKEHVAGDIGLIGFSMGGTTSILAAAEEPGIIGVVADSPFGGLKPYLQANLSVWSRLPKFPFTPLILVILPRITGVDPRQVDAFSAIERVYPRPVLFIHSEHDAAVPCRNSEAMWHRYKDRFDFWQTKLVGHVGSYQMYRQEYTSRVLDFFEKC